MRRLLLSLLFGLTLLSAGVHINSASKNELMQLKGIGAKTAVAIIEYRNKHKFTSIQELEQIKGIGSKKFEKLKKNIEL